MPSVGALACRALTHEGRSKQRPYGKRWDIVTLSLAGTVLRHSYEEHYEIL
jgi:hypothetical protein